MSNSRLVLVLALATVVFSGCILTEEQADADTQQSSEPDVVYDDSLAMGGDWVLVTGPCPGSETNALWFDDRQHGWVGCGQNAEGAGLYRTSDGGFTWESLSYFDAVRVNDIRRGPDGVLYGAGFHTLEGYSAWYVDENAEPRPVGLFQPGSNAFAKVAQGENIAVTQDGQFLVDSLTGVSAAYQPADGSFTEFSCLGEASLADPEAEGFQVRRIQAFDNRFYATGSLMSLPGMVYLPSKLDGATHHLQPLALQADGEAGELLDLHIWSATHMIVAGIDQGYGLPLVFVANGDPYVKSNWKQVRFADSGIDYEAGINGIAVTGDIVVAVGEKIPTDLGGFVAISADGGLTWAEITPKDPSGGFVKPLTRAWRFANGDMVVAGSSHEMWIYTAP